MKKVIQIARIIAEKINPEYIPGRVKPICIVSGADYQMGYQIGMQAREAIYHSILHLSTRIMGGRKNQDISGDMYKYNEVLEKQSPEIVEMLHGTADAIELPYEAMLIYTVPNLMGPVPNACSTISAWGSMTETGGLFCGANADGGAFTPTAYSPTLICFPKNNGNICIGNGGYNSNFAINQNGLVTMASNGGWNGRAGDIGYGTPAVMSTLEASLRCKDARETVKLFTETNVPVGSAENFHCADVNGNTYVIESTFGHFQVRKSGDFDETDCLAATNFFLGKEMQSSKRENNPNDINSIYRYRTEMQKLKEHAGKININLLDDILSCRDYYDGEDWVRNVWDTEKSRWTPEKRSMKNATYMQCFADAEHLSMYFRQGEKCTTCSNVYGSTGGRSKIVLKNSPEMLVEEMLCEAKKRLYSISAVVEQGQIPKNTEIQARINDAKKSIWIGDNYKAKSVVFEENSDMQMKNLSLAATKFAFAQALLDVRGISI